MKGGNSIAKTKGTVISVKEVWWIKVNTKPVRRGALDGALFPNIITISYEVNGEIYQKKKFLWIDKICPKIGAEVTVEYAENAPKKAKMIL